MHITLDKCEVEEAMKDFVTKIGLNTADREATVNFRGTRSGDFPVEVSVVLTRKGAEVAEKQEEKTAEPVPRKSGAPEPEPTDTPEVSAETDERSDESSEPQSLAEATEQVKAATESDSDAGADKEEEEDVKPKRKLKFGSNK